MERTRPRAAGFGAEALAALALLLWLTSAAQAQNAADRGNGGKSIIDANKGVVELETGHAGGVSALIAEDLANLLDDGATRRVLPVIGKGSLQNVVDLRSLRGIDVAIIQADALDYARDNKVSPGIESAVTYIAKLYNEELHILARRDIARIEDLAGKPVNFDVPGAGTGVTAGKLFSLLHIAVRPTNYDTQLALDKLAKGEIAAVAYVAGKPAPLFRDIPADSGFHFLAVPLQPAVTAVYVPSRLTGKDYPALLPGEQAVDTVAVGAVLAAANLQPRSERYRNVSNFVEAFFTQFSTLLEPGHNPKWREVNLAAELPGWKRFPPADQWLKRNQTGSPQIAKQDLKEIFSRFLDERRQLAGGSALSQQQKDELFNQFERWQESQSH